MGAMRRRPPAGRGARFGRKPKLSEHQQVERRRSAGESCRQIAKTFGVHRATLSRLNLSRTICQTHAGLPIPCPFAVGLCLALARQNAKSSWLRFAAVKLASTIHVAGIDGDVGVGPHLAGRRQHGGKVGKHAVDVDHVANPRPARKVEDGVDAQPGGVCRRVSLPASPIRLSVPSPPASVSAWVEPNRVSAPPAPSSDTPTPEAAPLSVLASALPTSVVAPLIRNRVSKLAPSV